MTSSLMTTYNRLAVEFTHGKGAMLYDTHGGEYLDALSGIAVCGLGHAHPAISAAVCDQAGKLVHTSNLYGIELQQQLADKLTALSGMQSVFFSNSGAEANEAAITAATISPKGLTSMAVASAPITGSNSDAVAVLDVTSVRNTTSNTTAAITRTISVSYTHLTLPTTLPRCRSRWSPYH